MRQQQAVLGASPAPLVRDPYSWGGPTYPSYDGRMEDPPAPAPGAGSTGGPPPPGGSAPPPGAGDKGAPPAPGEPGTGEPGPGKPADSEGLRNLRGAYDGLKGKHKPFEDLGATAEELGASHKFYTEYNQQISAIAQELDYPDEQIKAAIAQHGLAQTLQFLQQEKAKVDSGKSQGDKDLETRLQSSIDRRFKPLQDAEQQRQLEASSRRFDSRFDGLYGKRYTGEKALSDGGKELLYDHVSAALLDDPDALQRFQAGKGADLERIFAEQGDRFDKAIQAEVQRELERVGAGGVSPGPGQKGKPRDATLTLDDIMLGTEKAQKAMPSLRERR